MNLRNVFSRTLKKLGGSYRRQGVVVIGCAAILTAILSNLEFNLLEANLYDFRMARSAQKTANPDIVLVTLDDKTTTALDEFSPLPLDFHAQFLEALEKLHPSAVGYLVDLNQVNQANPDLFHTDWATRFVQAARRMETSGTTLLLGTPYDVTGEVVPPYPLSTLPHSIARIHKDGNVFSEDKVTRRAFTYLNGKPVFHLELAQRLGLIETSQRPRGNFHLTEVDGDYLFFRYHGGSEYPRIPFISLLRGEVPESAIRGKIVLVGTLSKDDSSDFAFTPYSKAAFANPKLVVHANILDSIIHEEGIIRAPQWVNWIVTFGVTALVLWWVLNSTPLYGVFLTLALALGILVLGHALFQARGLWLREAQPLVGIFVGYYLIVPYRLIREYKKRWDYQRKNELLTQVEELKTNFVYLVTHDLKTPVARIQGMAEVLLRKAQDRLVERDKETLRSIMNATDELNHFINSILELSRVENNRLQLTLESKDLNVIIERAVDGFKAQSRARHIQLACELEPLFPVRIDAGLISKVINNLIDNALKYSPENSAISLRSREEGEWIVVSVRDQGIGMTPAELGSLFTRFYRAKNDTTTRITGTGLGLYLTKYFVEAHGGRVEVASELGQGTEFRMLLPVAGATGSIISPSQPGLTQSPVKGDSHVQSTRSG